MPSPPQASTEKQFKLSALSKEQRSSHRKRTYLSRYPRAGQDTLSTAWQAVHVRKAPGKPNNRIGAFENILELRMVNSQGIVQQWFAKQQRR